MNYKDTAKHVASILMADDDADDRLLVKDALADVNFPEEYLTFVEDGQDLMDYLLRQGKYCGINPSKLPDLILLDLNMPRKDGREALKEIKSYPELKHIPVVVFTTSTSNHDVKASYVCGANTYISKSLTFDGLVTVMQTIKSYWADNALVTQNP